GLEERRVGGRGVAAHRLVLFCLRRTRRGGPCACGFACPAGFAVVLPSSALSPSAVVAGGGSGSCSRGAVREERFGGAAGFGIRRRGINPWPTVQRVVVTP